ncbi:MAG: sporulation protein YabP [Christensenellales bacterium]|jgi:sporulation protein YabP
MMRELEDEMIKARPHRLVIDDRERITLSGVQDVESFDENEIVVHTDAGVVVIAGENLHLVKLNLDEGQLVAAGFVSGVDYSDIEEQKKGRLFSGIFR